MAHHETKLHYPFYSIATIALLPLPSWKQGLAGCAGVKEIEGMGVYNNKEKRTECPVSLSLDSD